MKEVIISLLNGELKLNHDELSSLIEIPPNSELGDYALPCFTLAKQLKKNPAEIAKDLAKIIITKKPKEISEIQVHRAYINFFISKSLLADKVINDVIESGADYGRGSLGKGKKLVVEFSSPNIAKPFGIGHLRSTIIGNSLSRIHEFLGFSNTKINYLGDWGTQFGKLIFAYNKWGDDDKLKKDPINYLLKLYVKANKKEYEDDGRVYFKKLEDGDTKSLSRWNRFRKLSLSKFNEIYDNLGVSFDVVSGESEYNDKMPKILSELKSKGLLVDSEGALVVDLNDYGLGVSLIKKSDGTSLYVTRDLAAAVDRKKKFKFDRMIYEVGKEQTLHFKQLFKILELLGYEWSGDCLHVSHGLYLGNDGKRLATRKGKTVFMEDILNETIDKSRKELKSRYKLSVKELESRSLKIALAAIVYGDLKNYRVNDMVFDIDRFVSFDGNTGPYLLYSYARANSIIKKSKSVKKDSKSSKKLSVPEDIVSSEYSLIKLLSLFPNVVVDSYDKLDPSLIANYSYDLAKQFNEFYHSCPVIGSEDSVKSFRISLVNSFITVLGNALWLLGIEPVGEM